MAEAFWPEKIQPNQYFLGPRKAEGKKTEEIWAEKEVFGHLAESQWAERSNG
jgi:hypothetical protein